MSVSSIDVVRAEALWERVVAAMRRAIILGELAPGLLCWPLWSSEPPYARVMRAMRSPRAQFRRSPHGHHPEPINRRHRISIH